MFIFCKLSIKVYIVAFVAYGQHEFPTDSVRAHSHIHILSYFVREVIEEYY